VSPVPTLRRRAAAVGYCALAGAAATLAGAVVSALFHDLAARRAAWVVVGVAVAVAAGVLAPFGRGERP
jgi:membrane-associated PAP2 superfamily phosphatase